MKSVTFFNWEKWGDLALIVPGLRKTLFLVRYEIKNRIFDVNLGGKNVKIE